MIVQPDFPDHWKTQALISATSDPAAPMMVIRLWAHCHYRRASKFKNLSDIALAGICKWRKEPSLIRGILEECGFIHTKQGVLTVHDWDETNASLIARWRGGEANRRRLLGKPKLRESLAISLAGSDKRRVEKSRVEKKRESLSAHAEFIQEWELAYKEHFGENYAFQSGKDAAAVKQLLTSSKKSPSELLRIAKAAWNHRGFFSKGAASISGFNSKFNDIRNELNLNRNGSAKAPCRPGYVLDAAGHEYKDMTSPLWKTE